MVTCAFPVGEEVYFPGARSASSTVGTVSIPGIERPGRNLDQPTPSITEVKERVKLYLYYFSGDSCPVLGLTLRLPHICS